MGGQGSGGYRTRKCTVYLATQHDVDRHKYRTDLEALGYDVRTVFTETSHYPVNPGGIMASDVFVAVEPWAFVEGIALGLALAANMRTILIGPGNDSFSKTAGYETWEEALDKYFRAMPNLYFRKEFK